MRKKKLNYIHSRAYADFPMINGQGLGEISKMRYGLCRMSFNGCEVISVYNALVFLGIPEPIEKVADFMERYRVLVGIFGGNVYKTGRALQHFGADFQKNTDLSCAEAFIVSYWTGKRFLSSIHTVFCERSGGKIKVYNRYNNYPSVQFCSNLETVTGRKKPIAVYAIKKEKK